MGKNIIFVSDFNFLGSGYLNISVPLCKGLSDRGHQIKAIGLGYFGEEHSFDFSIIPCVSLTDAFAMVNNLKYQWTPDLVIVALDIPMQRKFSSLCRGLGLKIIAITPLENPPLTFSWAASLQQIEKVFFISELGTQEAIKEGVQAEHLLVGMDTESWRLRTHEEYTKGREFLNISADTMVIMTVGANQERKNLSKAMEIVSKLKNEKGMKIKYILVTGEQSKVGWNLRDLAMTYNIASELMIFEKGISFRELYSLYAISDAFLLTSKAEGLCMPVMEAMSIGVPVVATNCGAMPELLGEGRGFLMETEYSMIDPWGNSRRDFPDADDGVFFLKNIYDYGYGVPVIENARRYMEGRKWEIAVDQVDRAMEILGNEQKSV